MDGIRISLSLLFTSAGLACSMGAGCSADDGGAPPDAYASAPRTSQYEAGAAARPYDDGYATAAPSGEDDDKPLVPKTARLAAEGRGDLSYKATRDGYVYIVDHRDHTLVFECPLDEGETLTIAPYRNAIEVDGKRVKKVKDLDNKHIHRIFFERESDSHRSHKERERDRRER